MLPGLGSGRRELCVAQFLANLWQGCPVWPGMNANPAALDHNLTAPAVPENDAGVDPFLDSLAE